MHFFPYWTQHEIHKKTDFYLVCKWKYTEKIKSQHFMLFGLWAMFQCLSIVWRTTSVPDKPTPLTFTGAFAIPVNFTVMIYAYILFETSTLKRSPSATVAWTFWFHVNMATEPFKSQPHKMVKHPQTIRRQKPTNYLNVFDNFMGLALKGLNFTENDNIKIIIKSTSTQI